MTFCTNKPNSKLFIKNEIKIRFNNMYLVICTNNYRKKIVNNAKFQTINRILRLLIYSTNTG